MLTKNYFKPACWWQLLPNLHVHDNLQQFCTLMHLAYILTTTCIKSAGGIPYQLNLLINLLMILKQINNSVLYEQGSWKLGCWSPPCLVHSASLLRQLAQSRCVDNNLHQVYWQQICWSQPMYMPPDIDNIVCLHRNYNFGDVKTLTSELEKIWFVFSRGHVMFCIFHWY